jgi:transposase
MPAGAGSDPAVVIELRDELRERAQRGRGRDLRRRYSDEQIDWALALVARGKTTKQAAHAVGAPRDAVCRWVKRAGRQRVGGRRYYTGGEISHALALVEGGASLRQAAAAVGASSASVLRWARQGAA